MRDLIPLFSALAVLAVILAHIAIWAPRQLWIKFGALATTVAFMPVAYASLSTMLGRPKPIEMEWSRQQLSEAAVLGARLEEGKAIYVWLGIDGVEDPRSYSLPWDQELAKQLNSAQRTAQQNGTQVHMRLPFENSLDQRDQQFYAAAVPPPAEKQQETQNPLQFKRSDSNTSGSTN